jgi:sarcosine oxidase subunit gamma
VSETAIERPALVLREGLALLSLAAPPGAIGIDLPSPGRWTAWGGQILLWCAPNQFLAIAEPGALPLPPGGAAIDLTDSRLIVRLSGAAARDCLARLLPLDLHPRAFRTGHVASTVAAHIPVQIWQVDDAPTYDIACARSFGETLLNQLETAGIKR